MQQTLEKLFTWKYFEPTLFVTIGVLLLLLFIVFFVGNKDKKQKDGATGTTDTPAFDDVAPVQDVAIPEPVNEIKVDEVPSVIPAVEESPIDNDLPPVIITDTPEIKPIDSVEISGNASSELPDEVPVDESVAKQTPEIPAVVTEEEPEKEEPDFEVFGNNEEKKPAEDAFGSTPEEKEIDIPPVVVAEEEPDLPPITVTTEAEKEEKEEEPEKEETPEEVEIPDFKESFNELASSISKELDEISRLQNNPKSEIKEEKEEAKPIEIPNNIETTPLDDSKFTPSSVFSSVYIDKGEEDRPVLEEETEPDIPFFGQESSKPDMELPAMKEETKEPEANDTEVNVPDFSAFDNETFNIK